MSITVGRLEKTRFVQPTVKTKRYSAHKDIKQRKAANPHTGDHVEPEND